MSGLDLQPWAEALLRERMDNHMKDWPPSYCLPAGAVPFFTSGFFKLVHHPATLVFMVENATGFTQMLLDGRPHPPSVGPNWLGHSARIPPRSLRPTSIAPSRRKVRRRV